MLLHSSSLLIYMQQTNWNYLNIWNGYNKNAIFYISNTQAYTHTSAHVSNQIYETALTDVEFAYWWTEMPKQSQKIISNDTTNSRSTNYLNNTKKKNKNTKTKKKKKTEAINEQNLKDQNENQTNVWGNVDNKCVCKCFYG